MPYDEYLADRIRKSLKEKKTYFEEMKMMDGLCFKVDNKMLCGIHIDKKFGDSLLMTKIGEDAYEIEIEKDNTLPMDFTGRHMKGYVYVTPLGFDTDDDLSNWLDKTLAFNPLAKASNKKSKKKVF
jgi:hypothetical protein